jgi:ABC-type polysaccharide/polyol phosphate export permease
MERSAMRGGQRQTSYFAACYTPPMNLYHQLSLIDTMARMALKADAALYYFGYVWWVLEPLQFVAMFYLVFELILGAKREDFLVFLMCGKLSFVWFSKSVTHAARSIIAANGLIGRVHVPKALFPLAVIQEGLYQQAPVFLLFTSGVFWDVRALPDPATTAAVLAWNPLAFISDAYRQILMQHSAPDLVHLAALGLAAALCTGAMLLLLRRYSQFLALRADGAVAEVQEAYKAAL